MKNTGLGSAKGALLKAASRFLVGPARAAVRRGREVRYKAKAALFPRRMAYRCPCCGMRLDGFSEGPYQKRPERYDPRRYASTRQDVLCPVCGSLPRHRMLALWCEGNAEALRSAHILYFAPERAMMRWMARNGVRCTTADLSAPADLKLDIQATGLPGGSYDVVVRNHELEHVDDFRAALGEVRRVLRTGGTLVCSFPMDPKVVDLVDEDPSVRAPEERLRRYGQSDHLRVFGMRAGRLLEEAGFDVEEIRGEDCPDEILPVVGPADYDANVLFRCVKA